MGRKVRTKLPQTSSQLIPDWKYMKDFRKDDNKYKEMQKRNYDKRHRVCSQAPLPEDTQVLVKTGDRITSGTIESPAETPRSYVVETPSGMLRRNRSHLIPLNGDPPSHSPPLTLNVPRSPIMTRSRTGTEIRPPDKLNL